MPSFDLFGLKSDREGQNSAIVQIGLEPVVMEYNAGCQSNTLSTRFTVSTFLLSTIFAYI